MQKQILTEELLLIKKQLPTKGSALIISGMVHGAYTPGTIKQMLNGWRSINPGVLQAAKELIDIINQAKPKSNETNE